MQSPGDLVVAVESVPLKEDPSSGLSPAPPEALPRTMSRLPVVQTAWRPAASVDRTTTGACPPLKNQGQQNTERGLR